jgi:glutathione S-transferase
VTVATLTINSKNYGSWSLRGWLLCRMAGLDFTEHALSHIDPDVRAELLQRSPSFLVPCLEHDGVLVWDTLAIAEHLNETLPDAHLLPEPVAGRSAGRCTAASPICGPRCP